MVFALIYLCALTPDQFGENITYAANLLILLTIFLERLGFANIINRLGAGQHHIFAT